MITVGRVNFVREKKFVYFTVCTSTETGGGGGGGGGISSSMHMCEDLFVH